MKRFGFRSSFVSALLVVFASTAVAAQDLTPQVVSPAAVRSASEAKGLGTPDPSAKACVTMTMSCNSTVMGILDATDCLLGDGTRIDFWEFGVAQQDVTINLTSNEFDTFLFLLDPASAVVATDDDSGTGTNSLIVYSLDASGTWTIGANGFDPSDLGNYTLRLECSGGPGGPPAAPSNLTATTLSGTEVELSWQDNSDNEVEFRVEVMAPGTGFVDIGSVPADTILVDVTNLDPATTYSFRVRARNGDGDSDYSNEASTTTFGADPIFADDFETGTLERWSSSVP